MDRVLTTRIHPELHEKLKELAYQKRSSMNKVVTELIEDAVKDVELCSNSIPKVQKGTNT